MLDKADTICALATGNGIGAISVIRVSGKDSWKIVSEAFSKDITGAASHTVHFGTIKNDSGALIDEVLVTLFAEGKSFTGEESAEISCHGSPYVRQKITEALIKGGCRLAEPGEYTQRAFLNGKMDLSQAEAVADLIASSTKSAHDVALKQLRGGFSTELKALREKLIEFASLVELELDFSEEDVEFADRGQLEELVKEVLTVVNRLAQSFELGNAIKSGVPVAIVGAPNTGKSTLLNQLIGDDRAIVSEIEGTTRDVIEERLNIEGIEFRLIDTAGIREGAEQIEAMGIERSHAKIEQAKIVLCMADCAIEKSVDQVTEWAKDLITKYPDKTVHVLANKRDLVDNTLKNVISISAKTGKGIEELKGQLVKDVMRDFDLGNETIVVNDRHHQALLRTSESLEKTLEGLETGVTGDFIAMDIRQAMHHLGSITGDISTDDLLGNIFSNFCIGK